MVCVVKPGYSVSYDKSLLNGFNFENALITMRYLLCGPPRSKGEGIFYRIVQKKGKKCIQCIVFYKTQWIPYHPHDYHPFYIYLTANNQVEYLIIDDGHHFSKLIPIENGNKKKIVNITIFLPDHGLTDQITQFSKSFKPKLIPLLPNHIRKWWLINDMAQMKLRTKLIDPWAKGLIPANPSKKESLIYRLNHLLPRKLFPFAEENLKYTFRDESICPECQCIETLDFMALHKQKSTHQYFLQKAIKCKKRHSYIIKYNFENGELEYS